MRSFHRFLVLAAVALLASCSDSDDGTDCPSGQIRCDGICVSTASNSDHCGACGNACGENQVCSNSACESDCDEGLELCGQSCVNFDTDAQHCGSCDMDCTALPNVASATCGEGACEIVCEEGFADCDGDPSNGCEANLTADSDHCGACGTACRDDQVCGAEGCGCPAEQQECDGICTDPDSDPMNCGGCGNVCSEILGNVESATCEAGTCVAETCADGWDICGDDVGCDTHTDSDVENCGACDIPCREDQTCNEGVCGCGEGMTECDGVCVDTENDADYCGACDVRCEEGEVCVEGACALDCPDGQEACDGSCVDTNTSTLHCGTCGNACMDGGICDEGTCVCPAGEQICDDSCVDTNNDPMHCGDCGEACAEGGICVDGGCECPDGGEVCDGVCRDTQTDNDHCGGCGIVCNGVCSAGECFDPSAIDISSRDAHTCAVLVDGTVRCWGLNNFGQLGNGYYGKDDDGEDLVSKVPTKVVKDLTGTPLTGIKQIFVGAARNVGTTTNHFSCSLNEDSRMWCWGANERAFLVAGPTQKAVPYAVEQGYPGYMTETIVQVAPGNIHGCGRFVDGTAKCWGYGVHGQLGIGPNKPTGTTYPTYVKNPENTGPLQGVVDVTTGFNSGCAVLDNGKAVCWGDNTTYKLGNPEKNELPLPRYVVDPTDDSKHMEGIASISSGGTASCAVMQDGTARCWGYMAASLGDGLTQDSYKPVTVANSAGTPFQNITDISVGYQHTCFVSDGKAYCWGQGTFGRLGNGGRNPSAHPVTVMNSDGDAPLEGVRKIEAGFEHTCLLTNDGEVYCFGNNSMGELGDGGTLGNSSLPVRVNFLP